MTAITITPRNKKELLALKQFIKVNDLTFEESVSEVNEQSSSKSSISKMPKEYKPIYEALGQTEKDALDAQSRLYRLETDYQVRNFC